MKKFNRLLFVLLLLTVLAHVATAQTVYITQTGAKYHTGSCRYLRYSKIATTLTSAKASGYGACSVCAPPTTVTETKPNLQAPATPASPIRQVASTQCTGTTKSGARCKRKTTNANGRCYQH